MACSYCFYLEKEKLFTHSKIHRMSEDVLEEMIRQFMSQSGTQVSFGWQGGEPTLMGLPFFRKAVELQQKYGHNKEVGNGLQTNGLLIDKYWIRFLKEFNFLVGLSIDGPEHIHDHYRLLGNGSGSWSKVLDRGKLMFDAGVAVNAITVVSDYSVQFPEEIYTFNKETGFNYMQFIPCVETDPENSTRATSFSVSGENYGKFLCKIFDLWHDDFEENRPTASVRFFDSLFYSYVGMEPPECTLLKECGVYVVVEHNGDVYSCDFFVEPDWKLGNIMEKRLIDMLNSRRQREFGKLKASLPESCKKCSWVTYCRGGCTKDRIRDARDNGLNHFCQAYKMFFEHADSRFKLLAHGWKKQQAMHQEEDGQALSPSHKQKSGKIGRNAPCPCGSGFKYKKCCGRN
jgi:uncharacterized protein